MVELGVNDYIDKGITFISSFSKTLTEKVVNFLSLKGFDVSVRWASILLIFLSGLIIFLSMKITQKVLKIILIILSVLLIIGFLIPSW